MLKSRILNLFHTFASSTSEDTDPAQLRHGPSTTASFQCTITTHI